MTEMTVRYFGILHELTGKRVEKIQIEDNSNLMALIKKLAEEHGSKFSAFLYDSRGKLNKSIAFAVDGDSIGLSKLSSTKCKDVKEFVILPPISGGMNHTGFFFLLGIIFNRFSIFLDHDERGGHWRAHTNRPLPVPTSF